MRISITFLLAFFTGHLCSAQAKVDTSWILNGHNFRLLLEADEDAAYDLNAKATLFRDNIHCLPIPFYVPRCTSGLRT